MLKKAARRFLSIRSGSTAAWTSTVFFIVTIDIRVKKLILAVAE